MEVESTLTNAINFYRIPKTTIARSMPLPAMVSIDQRIETHSRSIFLELESLDEGYEAFEGSWVFEPLSYISGVPSVDDPNRLGLILPPNTLPSGAYGMRINDAGARHDIDEILWIMPDDEYRSRNDRISEEPFEPARGMDADAVSSFAAQLIEHELRSDRFDLDLGWVTSRSNKLVEVHGWSDVLFPDSAVRWAISNALEAFRYRACAGVSDARWGIHISDSNFSVEVDAGLLISLHDPLEASIQDATLFDLEACGWEYEVDMQRRDAGYAPQERLNFSIGFAIDTIPLASVVETDLPQ